MKSLFNKLETALLTAFSTGDKTAKGAAEAAGVNPRSITSALKNMEVGAYVTKTRDGSDTVYHLTDRGRMVLEQSKRMNHRRTNSEVVL